MKLIAIDGGHGMDTPGKRTPVFPDGTIMKENEFNRATATLLAQALERNGFQTLLVAPETTDTPLQTRVKRANDAKADAYIAIHANAYGNDWNAANGIESWIYSKSSSQTVRLAEDIQEDLVAATKRKNRGIKKNDDLYVLRYTKMMAVLVECGFLTNLEEATLLRENTYRKACAEGICKGICQYYQVPYRAEAIQGDCCPVRYQTVSQLPYGKETIELLLDKGWLKGDEKGNLNLTLDMLRIFIILDRAGLFGTTKLGGTSTTTTENVPQKAEKVSEKTMNLEETIEKNSEKIGKTEEETVKNKEKTVKNQEEQENLKEAI